MMTEAEVMAKLELRPWEDILGEARLEAERREALTGSHSSSRRRSGRTWRMLVLAVVAASRGQTVTIEGHEDRYERQLRDQARDWCKRCGVDPELILLGKERKGATVYVTDHHVFEACWLSMAKEARHD